MPKAKKTRPESREVAVSKEGDVEKAETLEGSQEVEVQPESAESSSSETQEDTSSSRDGEDEGAVRAQVQAAQSSDDAQVGKDPVTQKLESILEEDLKEAYMGMDPEKQAEFKAKGEEVVGTIRTMIKTAKFSAKKVVKLIRDWLRIIPGVNKFFLEQETKLKTDKIAVVAEEENKNSIDQT